MRESARRRVLDTLADDALLLDVGGWAVPFPRADWMLDLGAYATRGEWGYEGDPAAERFSADTWVQRDICDREPWPFADDQFDFAICSHTLEDVRDPIWVCQELQRVAKAGYIETPSRLEEQCYGFQGPWTGWGHHHWIVEPTGTGLTFLFKHHIVHAPQNRFPAGFHETLTEDQKVTSLWWEDSFTATELILGTPAELDAYLADFVSANGGVRRGRRRSALRGRR
ncbi:MAG: hypothetical protein QOF76_5514 [Solirubrobacteraceae bacterium]|jgi:hypothetical protein|nr:hypothetical protein [Solirubrobacteraceae bacterium]